MSHLGPPQMATITVVGGTGTATITLGGPLCAIGCKGPAGSVYDCEVVDIDSFGVAGATSIPGTAKIDSWVQLYGPHTVNITNATIDGTYKVKFWYS